jgi:hypothetical protein
MSWTLIVGASDYSNGKTISHQSNLGSSAVDPFLNTSGHQDYTTYYQGGNGKAIVPDPGNSGLSAPTAGHS